MDARQDYGELWNGWQDARVVADEGSGPREVGSPRGPSARAYLLILLGEYALEDGDGVWTQTAVDALRLVGFEEKATRQALNRTATAGLLDPVRVGRRTRWRITPSGRQALDAAGDRLFGGGPGSDWDGDWLMLLTSVPETHRQLRHRLRTSLSWAGFGALGPGVWLSPHPSHAAEARQVLDALGPPVRGILLQARLDDPAEQQRLVTQAWDVADLDRQYRAFIDRFGAGRPQSPADALAHLAHLVYEWRRLLLADPGLPATLLPPGWNGGEARRLLLEHRQRWHPLALGWWRAGPDGPEDRPD
jgi:phenylacetic acid degradation operon negative regulatory protein